MESLRSTLLQSFGLVWSPGGSLASLTSTYHGASTARPLAAADAAAASYAAEDAAAASSAAVAAAAASYAAAAAPAAVGRGVRG